MFGGRYFVEENLINPVSKSLQTRLVSLPFEFFHRYVEPEKLTHLQTYKQTGRFTVAHSYIRSFYNSSRVFQNIYVEDEDEQGLLSFPFYWLRELKLRMYLLSK